MQTLLQDFRYGFRQLVKMPGFTLTAVLSLALGIGATTAVFSVVYAILMDPYPYAAPDRMAHMLLATGTDGRQGFGLTGGQWQQIRKSPVVEDAVLVNGWSLTVTDGDLPEDVEGVFFSSNAADGALHGVERLDARFALPQQARALHIGVQFVGQRLHRGVPA